LLRADTFKEAQDHPFGRQPSGGPFTFPTPANRLIPAARGRASIEPDGIERNREAPGAKERLNRAFSQDTRIRPLTRDTSNTRPTAERFSGLKTLSLPISFQRGTGSQSVHAEGITAISRWLQ
jgi:hypothetical protein